MFPRGNSLPITQPKGRTGIRPTDTESLVGWWCRKTYWVIALGTGFAAALVLQGWWPAGVIVLLAALASWRFARSRALSYAAYSRSLTAAIQPFWGSFDTNPETEIRVRSVELAEVCVDALERIDPPKHLRRNHSLLVSSLKAAIEANRLASNDAELVLVSQVHNQLAERIRRLI